MCETTRMSLGGANRALRVAWAIGAPLCAILVVAAITAFRASLRFWARPDDGSDAQGAGNVLMFLFTAGLVWTAILIAGGLAAATTGTYYRRHRRD
jgi:hypothetical protein